MWAWHAGSLVSNWAEEHRSVIVTESPLSLVACTFQSSIGGDSGAVIESWYGAQVRLEDVEFRQCTIPALFNDDPSYSPRAGVFFADAAEVAVNSSDGTVGSTKPLSAAPSNLFFCLDDAQFLGNEQVPI